MHSCSARLMRVVGVFMQVSKHFVEIVPKSLEKFSWTISCWTAWRSCCLSGDSGVVDIWGKIIRTAFVKMENDLQHQFSC